MKYTIPSKGRGEIIGETVDLLGGNNVLVYVHEDEYEFYSKSLTKKQLKVHDCKGIGAIRRFMYEDNKKEDYTFQFDDDIIALEYKFSDKMEIIVDPKHIKAVIDNCYQMALDIGTPLFGIAAGVGPMLYSQLNVCMFSGFVNAVNTGVIPKLMGDINWDPRFTVMHEDHDISLQVKYHKRYLYIDGRYSIKANEKIGAGMSTIRNYDEHEKCHKLLKLKYGSVIGENPKTKYLNSYRVKLNTGF